jgi:hypothetical protein
LQPSLFLTKGHGIPLAWKNFVVSGIIKSRITFMNEGVDSLQGTIRCVSDADSPSVMDHNKIPGEQTVKGD